MLRVCTRTGLLLLALLLAAGGCLAAPEEIVLSFAGDCTLGSENKYQYYEAGFVEVVRKKGFAHPFSGVKHIFEADDLTLVNLEGVFTELNKGEDKSFIFRAPPEYAAILPFGSVEAVNIANNHIRDFGEQGRADTIAALDAVGVTYSGDGILAILDVRGVRIGMTGYSYPHYNTLTSLETNDIPQLRGAGCDIIILSMHAGTEEEYKVGSGQRDLARGAIDLGVDIVVGHHPHVVQGVEVYQGKPIFYSLGNFAFGGNINPKDWDTIIGQVVLEKDGADVQLRQMHILPCRISGEERWSDYRPVLVDGEDAERIMQRIEWSSPDVDPEQLRTRALPLGE